MSSKIDKWDVFICHASEDKEPVADPLYEALTKADLRVWYDKTALKLGDRLHKVINLGIIDSAYGIVILSKNFFNKDWPQRELEAFVAKEHSGRKVILPIWHEIDADYIRHTAPMFSGIHAVSTARGIENIVQRVLEVVKPSEKAKTKTTTPKIVEDTISTYQSLESKIYNLKEIDPSTMPTFVKDMPFEDLKEFYIDVLDAIALFNIGESYQNTNLFNFLLVAILERTKSEGSELFVILLNWYFGTATPNCNEEMIRLFQRLTRLSHLKRLVSKTKRIRDFVAEFGRSNSYEIAGKNAEILQNLKNHLSSEDCESIVDFALTNSQIIGSWRAGEYLIKLLPTCKDRVNPQKYNSLYRKLMGNAHV